MTNKIPVVLYSMSPRIGAPLEPPKHKDIPLATRTNAPAESSTGQTHRKIQKWHCPLFYSPSAPLTSSHIRKK